jgi:hypothetical protein
MMIAWRPPTLSTSSMWVDGRILQQRQARIDDLAQVVRRDVGGHADRDARGAVHQQVGEARRQHRRLHLLAVVVRHEIDRFHVDVGQQLAGDLLQAALRVAVGRRGIAVDRAEVALAVDQLVAHREVLRHAHQRLVGRRVAVRVVLAQDIAHDPRALHVRTVPDGVRLMHGEQDPAVDGLQAVTNIREGAADDDAHRVVQVGPAHLLLEADRVGFLGELFHGLLGRSVRPNRGCKCLLFRQI